MTTLQALKTPDVDRLKEMRTRLALSVTQCADMLNVSTYAVIKWENGSRAVSPATMRLIEILEMLEVMAPDMHAQFMPAK
jgi:DNA-binding transcriptional regulator YiaG